MGNLCLRRASKGFAPDPRLIFQNPSTVAFLTTTRRAGRASWMPPRRTCYAKGEFHFVDVHVGVRLRRRRELLGIKIQQLAALTGVSFQQIQKYETAQNRIAPSRLYTLAQVLAVEIGWFFDGLPPIATGKTRVVIPLHKLESPETASLVEAFLRLPADRRRTVLGLIQSIKATPTG
jgi:transcriptional regulator with XRE-family HTH domain